MFTQQSYCTLLNMDLTYDIRSTFSLRDTFELSFNHKRGMVSMILIASENERGTTVKGIAKANGGELYEHTEWFNNTTPEKIVKKFITQFPKKIWFDF